MGEISGKGEKNPYMTPSSVGSFSSRRRRLGRMNEVARLVRRTVEYAKGQYPELFDVEKSEKR